MALLLQLLLVIFQSTPPRGGDDQSGRLRSPPGYFNPRPLAGATLGCRTQTEIRFHFNPRPLAGATWWQSCSPSDNSDFNPRPLAGATVSQHAVSNGNTNFNPRPLAGATTYGVYRIQTERFQSTPPRGGDPMEAIENVIGYISIHAPSRGRLIPIALRTSSIAISIHAPSRGRQSRRPNSSRQLQFQSTPPRGGDSSTAKYLAANKISIHAPSRGRRDGGVCT